ncbi:MAG: condensation domain-containing protein [Polyangiaceae bacterium]
MTEHAGVSRAAVIVREDRPGDKRLVAYVTPAPGLAPSDAELRAHIKKSLPEYMVPQHFVRLSELPLLPNGKINRRALPEPKVNEALDAESFVAPRTASENAVALLWQEVLGVGRIGVHDDFFSLGGHSLLASQVIAKLRRDQGVEITFRTMFEAPTVAKLAAVIDGPSAKTGPHGGVIARRSAAGPAPLAMGQHRMWLIEEMDPSQRIAHNLCASWRLDGPLDREVFQRAVDEIARRHEPLRTGFRMEAGETVQVVHEDRAIRVRELDLSSRTESDRAAAIAADRDTQATTPFDLGADPLLRVTLYKVSPTTHVLSTVQHTMIWDGWSFDIFLRELSALYRAFSRGEPSPLLPLPIAFADFAAWQKQWLTSPEFEAKATFWRERLSGTLLPLELPTDRVRRGTRSHSGGSEGLRITQARVDALSALAREHGSTLFMVIFATFNVLLHRHTGQRDLLIGTPTRARDRSEVEELIGPFVNAVALRTSVDPSMTFLDLLDQVRERTLDAFSHQDVPLDAIGVRPPMMRALFSLQDARARPLDLGDVHVTQEHALAPVAANELMLWAMHGTSDLLLMINFAADLFDAATARRLLHRLDTLLEDVAREPGRRIGELAFLPASEREAIARAGAGAASSSPVGAAFERALGRPITGARVRVVDARGELAPIGVAGELVVEEGARTEPTGLRARLSADGTFETLGRVDGLVEVGGSVIDLAAASGALGSHPAVLEAWVTVRGDSAGDPCLVAYVVPRPGLAATGSDLRGWVRDKLGGDAVPRMFVELDALPRDMAGAVDDARLASPYATTEVHEHVAPRTAAEKYVAMIWREALGVARIGVYENFFDLGGHSLLCFRTIARIEREIGQRVSPKVVLLNTLEQVAAQITMPPGARAPEGVKPAAAEPHRRAAPPSPRDVAPDTTRAERAIRWLRGFGKS